MRAVLKIIQLYFQFLLCKRLLLMKMQNLYAIRLEYGFQMAAKWLAMNRKQHIDVTNC